MHSFLDTVYKVTAKVMGKGELWAPHNLDLTPEG